ncbi:unnamed protein product [Effrenium voratum]|nr:unnamed protein product [Effrenium voratum]
MPYAFPSVPGGMDEFDNLSPVWKSARKFAAFASHEELWACIEQCNRLQRPQMFNEVLEEKTPRCLYFDLDGPAEHKRNHDFIIEHLQWYVETIFCGDMMGWSRPEPVVLQSNQENKYSSHVLFPQIQFKDFRHQNKYMKILLRGTGLCEVNLDNNEKLLLLKQLVDPSPYKSLQLFRGPFACKLHEEEVMLESSLQPEGYFDDNELTCFASYVHPDYALELPSPEQILESKQALRDLQEDKQWAWRQDKDPALFLEDFRKEPWSGELDLAGLPKVDKYEILLKNLHYARSDDWDSWFRITGITCNMLRVYEYDVEAQERIWAAHCDWSSMSAKFDSHENWDRIMEASRSDHLPGLWGLIEMVKHDNPGLQVRERLFNLHFGAGRRLTKQGDATA